MFWQQYLHQNFWLALTVIYISVLKVSKQIRKSTRKNEEMNNKNKDWTDLEEMNQITLLKEK